MSDEILSAAEVAALLQLDPSQVARHARAGRFPGARRLPGHRGQWLIPRSALAEYQEWARAQRAAGRRGRPPRQPTAP